MHIHILGICGTFMGSLALLARTMGHQITGSDENIYPPMSTQLQQAGIDIQEGYLASHLQPAPDLVVVGNAMKRGMEAIEYMLNQNLPYTSGPQFLAEYILPDRHVLAVAGTHGKTTTTTMLAWILQYNGLDTGFLIGGVPLVQSDDPRLQSVFAHSSHLGSDYFVIEADEYDSAFFDKRSKFVHYRPRTAILNNLEFDHADIFANLGEIQRQFHHMIRMIPQEGRIILPNHTPSLQATLDLGCWTPAWRTQLLGEAANAHLPDDQTDRAYTDDWAVKVLAEDGSRFEIRFCDQSDQQGEVHWNLSGLHNVQNALSAVAAAFNVGVSVADACRALSVFSGIKRRMELIADLDGVQIFDDFAHHPTAIATTLDGAKKRLQGKKIWAIIEPRSNTMKLGVHKDKLAESAKLADQVIWYEPQNLAWGLREQINDPNQQVFDSTQAIIDHLVAHLGKHEAVIIMSNGGFENLHQRLILALNQR